MNISLILSIVSLLVAASAMLINAYGAWIRRPNIVLKLQHEEADCIYFKSPPTLRYFDSTELAIIDVGVYNKSQSPITISSFSIKTKNHTRAYYDSTLAVDFSLTFPSEDSSVSFEYAEVHKYTVSLPLKMQPYDYSCGYVVFPRIKGLVSENQEITLEAHTATKSFSTKLIISKIDRVEVMFQNEDGIYDMPISNPYPTFISE